MLIATVQQNDSVIHVYTHIVFHILFHYALSQDIEYNSLCCTVGPPQFVSANPKLSTHLSPTRLLGSH